MSATNLLPEGYVESYAYCGHSPEVHEDIPGLDVVRVPCSVCWIMNGDDCPGYENLEQTRPA